MHNGTIYRWNRPVYDVYPRQAAPARREPGPARRAVGRGRAGQRRVLLRPAHARWSRRTGRCGPGCRSPPPSDNFRTGARDGINAQLSTGRASARCRSPNSSCAGCCRWPSEGLDGVGRRRVGQRPAARRHRGPLHRPARTARNGKRARSTRIDDAAPAARPARRAARDAAPLHREHAHQRAGPHLATRLNGRNRSLAPRAEPHADQTRTTTLGSGRHPPLRRVGRGRQSPSAGVAARQRWPRSEHRPGQLRHGRAQITIPLRVSGNVTMRPHP